jgi:hypothetical protein
MKSSGGTLALAVLLCLTSTRPLFGSGRCRSGIFANSQTWCSCPDFDALLANPVPRFACPPYYTAVIYDLDAAPDGSASGVTFRGEPGSPCAGLEKKVPAHGQLVGCWSAPDADNCRSFWLPFYADCLVVDAVPLGPECTTPECADATTALVAIGSPGANGFRVCSPPDPNTSCTVSNVKFIQGGLCAAYQCDGDQEGPDTCKVTWGATLWGQARTGAPPGTYDWQTGTIRLATRQAPPVCGPLKACLGGSHARTRWTLEMVARPGTGFKPPCLPGPTNACSPADCLP